MRDISAIILAAGYGRRIGKTKLMLETGGRCYAEIINNNLSDCEITESLFVINKDSEEWFRKTLPEVKYIINPRPDDGMLSSIFLAYKQLGAVKNLIVFPVDHPFVSRETIEIIIETCVLNRECVIKPDYRGKSGHPIIIPYSLLSNCAGETLSAIIQNSGYKIISVPADDEGIIKNINSPSDVG